MRPLVLAHDLGVSLPTVLVIVTLSFPMVPMASMCFLSYCVGHFPHVLTRVCTMCLYISRAAWGLTVTIRRLLYAKEMTFKGKDGSTSVL